jgi:stearoyl-CoA desaturase (delta-9 desaturase)
MFFTTAFYHRYFSHRAFRTSRVVQFIAAFIAQTSAQRGALWWAAHHRVHHKESDTPDDVHSPIQDGLFYAHIGWIFADDNDQTRWDKIRDFAKYPELRFLNRFWLLPPILLALGCLLWLGWSGLVVGFFWSTVVLWHGTFTVNSLTHVIGRQRFETGERSKNSWLIATWTLGEGWHNNHHHYQSSVRQGFYWWEFDVTYYILKAMSWLGLVWDLREPPARVLAAGRESDRRR